MEFHDLCSTHNAVSTILIVIFMTIPFLIIALITIQTHNVKMPSRRFDETKNVLPSYHNVAIISEKVASLESYFETERKKISCKCLRHHFQRFNDPTKREKNSRNLKNYVKFLISSTTAER